LCYSEQYERLKKKRFQTSAKSRYRLSSFQFSRQLVPRLFHTMYTQLHIYYSLLYSAPATVWLWQRHVNHAQSFIHSFNGNGVLISLPAIVNLLANKVQSLRLRFVFRWIFNKSWASPVKPTDMAGSTQVHILFDAVPPFRMCITYGKEVFACVCQSVCLLTRLHFTTDQLFVKLYGVVGHNPETNRLDFEWPWLK